MAQPALRQPQAPSIIDATRQPIPPLPAAPPPPAWRTVALTMQHQKLHRWCWAAIAASVANFLGHRDAAGGRWTQCSVASKATGKDCCASSAPCNVDQHLADVLTAIGLPNDRIANEVLLPVLDQELAAGRPVCVHIDWGNNDGHFAAIAGVCDDPPRLAVEDPWFGSSDVDFAAFCTAYQGGVWDRTYTVKP